MLTIKQLRQDGYKVRVNIFRYSTKTGKKLIPLIAFRSFGVQNLITAKGGLTTVSVLRDNKEFKAESACSFSDIFNRKTGLELALKRLEEQIKEEKL